MPLFTTPSDLLAHFPPEWPEDLLPEIQAYNREANETLVVLDDDPTGTQTVYDVPVLTEWSEETFEAEFLRQTPVFYVLTNSRSLNEAETTGLHETLARRLDVVAEKTGRSYQLVNRGDSTLRGHFPTEPAALERGWGKRADAWLLIPFFREGGRLTVHDVHYIAEGEILTPAAETPFARDATFGYRNSDLKAWVEEKTGGAVRADDVVSLSLETIRQGGPEAVAERLKPLKSGQIVIVNALSLRDLEVVVRAVQNLPEKRFIFRTAASWVQVAAGLQTRPLLEKGELVDSETKTGGLTVVGSYVPKTTAQLTSLLESGAVQAVEIAVPKLLSHEFEAEVERVRRAVEAALTAGHDAVAFTSRALVQTADPAESLRLVNRVSAGLVELVRRLTVRPRYLIAKGGITSSDLAVKGLGVRRALVRGQILPGVPVWQTGDETRFPGLTYVVFPGNVGGEGALREAVLKMKA
jgi:uncharacterized protein YgbK (DUF1537 family)